VEKGMLLDGQSDIALVNATRASLLRGVRDDAGCSALLDARHRGSIYEPSTQPGAKARHADQVVSVIAAARNSKGVLGVLPLDQYKVAGRLAPVWLIRDEERLLIESLTYSLARPVSRCVPERAPPVFNLSFSFDNINTGNLGAFLGQVLTDWALFVAAAGEPGTAGHKGDEALDRGSCNVVPACNTTDLPNLISVVALNGAGTDVHPSSLWGPAFDVAAVGETFVLGDRPDEAVLRTGSSLAAPYVSALSSLIFGRHLSEVPERGPSSSDVRARIVSTVDFLGPNLSRAVRFGKINFQRALKLESDQILRKVEGACSATGARDSLTTPLARSQKLEIKEIKGFMALADQDAKNLKSISLEKVLRLSRDCSEPEDTLFDVVFIQDRQSRPPVVSRLAKVRFGNSSLRFSSTGRGDGNAFPISQLVDFVSCMSPATWQAWDTRRCLSRDIRD